MLKCPISFNHKQAVSFIEPFDGGTCPPPSGEGGQSTSQDYYENRRANNILSLDTNYNTKLGNYLNKYNQVLICNAMKKAGDPTSPPCGAVRDQMISEEQALQKYQKALETNNKATNELIKQQTLDIEAKSKAIEEKNKLINNQTKFIDDKNRVMNSRERQIELGVEKNVYKRNIMYFLIFVNILVLVILLGIIYRGDK